MTQILHSDAQAWKAHLAFQPAEIQRFGVAVGNLRDKVVREYREAESARRPADKVAHLELAKECLGVLIDCLDDAPGFTIEGLEAAQGAITRLESTFRAFGYYRMAGLGR